MKTEDMRNAAPHELMSKVSEVCKGHDYATVINVGMSLILSVKGSGNDRLIRETCSALRIALHELDDKSIVH